MKSKQMLILGGTDGIGRALANALATQHEVWIAGRNPEKGQSFVKEMGPNAHFLQADLSLMQNVVKLGRQVKAEISDLAFVVHSADILQTNRTNTVEGLEPAMAINFYSRVLLNELLLQDFQPERILHVAAAGYPMNGHFDQKFPIKPQVNGFTAHGYGQIANDYYGLWMAKRLQGTRTRLNILNPGVVATDIRRNATVHGLFKFLMPVVGFFMTRSAKSAAAYAKVILEIIQNKNPEVNRFTFLNEKGKGFPGNQQVRDERVQQYVYQTAIQQLNDIVGEVEWAVA